MRRSLAGNRRGKGLRETRVPQVFLELTDGRQPAGLQNGFDRLDSRAAVGREGDDADFEQVELLEQADVAVRLGLDLAVADRQALHRVVLEQDQRFGAGADASQEPALTPEALAVLGEV